MTVRIAYAVVAGLLFGGAAFAQSSVTITSSRDTSLYIENSALSNGAGSRLFTGINDNGERRRALLAFDVAAAIPPCATVLSVSLQLYMEQTQAGSIPVAAHHVTADWGEAGSVAGGGQGAGGAAMAGDATWTNRFFPGMPWASPGGDYVASQSATLPVSGSGFYTWTTTAALVADVQSWVDSPSSNFGWILLTPEVGSQTAKAFSTRESNNTSRRPMLTITYQPAGAASVTATGTGCVGSSGSPLSLTPVGLPSVGNLAFALNISGGPANGTAYAFLATGIASTPLSLGGGCLVHLENSSALVFFVLGISPLALPLNGSGALTVPLPLSTSCALIGQSLTIQVLVPDTGTVIATEALTLNFGS